MVPYASDLYHVEDINNNFKEIILYLRNFSICIIVSLSNKLKWFHRLSNDASILFLAAVENKIL